MAKFNVIQNTFYMIGDYNCDTFKTSLFKPMNIESDTINNILAEFKPAVAVHLALWYVLLVCHQYDVCENYVGSVYVGGYCGLSESGLCVFCKLCPVCVLVVGKGPSVLL